MMQLSSRDAVRRAAVHLFSPCRRNGDVEVPVIAATLPNFSGSCCEGVGVMLVQ